MFAHRIRRETFAGQYLYVNPDPEVASLQVACRGRQQEALAAVPLPASIIIEVLVELIQGASVHADPHRIAARLTARGISLTPEQVETVFSKYLEVSSAMTSWSSWGWSASLSLPADIGKDLLGEGHDRLRELFRQTGVRTLLRALARDLGRSVGQNAEQARDCVRLWQKQGNDNFLIPSGTAGIAIVRALAQWPLDFSADGSDEGFFHSMKHGERRRSGRKVLAQDFEQLPPAAALAKNLTHPDYVETVCGTLDRLPRALAALDQSLSASPPGPRPLPLPCPTQTRLIHGEQSHSSALQ